MKKTTLPFVALCLLALPLGAAPTPPRTPELPPAKTPAATRAERTGIGVDLSVETAGTEPGDLVEGKEALFRFRISDTATGTPLSGTYPAAWVELLPDAPGVESRTCTQAVEELIAGSLLARPELDLNVYHVLALNEDSTITVVDPLFGFGGTKLLAMVFLDSPGEDWVLTPDRKRLFVSLPDSNAVAVVDTLTWNVEAQIPVKPRPTRLALQPDGAYLWVTLEGEGGGVAALDTDKLVPAAVIATGPGRHEIAVADDNRQVYVANAADGTLSVIDVARLAKTKDVPLGMKPTSLAYSPIARAVYVTSAEAGEVVAADASGVLARMKADPGLGQVRFAPGGRLGLVVNPAKDRIHVLDASRNRLIQTGTLLVGPDQVSFSEHLAYVRHRGSETVLMIPLDQIGEEGKSIPVVDFPGGQNPLGAVSRPSPADSIVRAPGANAVLVANPRDKVIYFYKEGMAAPMGSFQNYSREPRAVMVVDRSLKERSPGAYETVARLPRPGHYQVAFFLDAPRQVHCFPLTVTADPQEEARRASRRPALLEPLVEGTARVGETIHLRFRVSDPQTREPRDGVRDLTLLIFESAGHGQWREPAVPVGEGVYEAEFTPQSPGNYHVSAESPSQNLAFHLSPRVIVRVSPRVAPPPSP